MVLLLSVAFTGAWSKTSAGVVTPEIRTLPNLSVPTALADPLPALRQNKPTASELAHAPRAHPYLLFDTQGRMALRARVTTEPYRSLYARLRQHAERCLQVSIPPQASMRDDLPMFLPEGEFNPEYAREEYATAFFKQSYLLREVLPTLAFAYQLTGEACYAAAGRQWLLEFAARSKFAPRGREADFHLAQVMYALSLGYDWLWEILEEKERTLVRGKLTELSLPLHEAGVKLLKYPEPQDIRGALGGNHVRRTQGLFAVTPLVLLFEVADAAKWLDVQITLHRDRLYPSAFAPNGEHVDMWDHFNTSLDDPIVFTVALKRMGGEDLFNDPRLAPRFRGLPHFALFGLEEWFGDGPTNRHGWNGPGENNTAVSWLALASHLKDPTAQWLATRENGLARLDEMLAFLFYDSTVAAVQPQAPKGSVYFPYSGQIRMCTNWEREGLLVSMRCGPRIPKDSGDENALRVRFADQWLVPALGQVDRTKQQTDDFIYDLMAWFRGTPAQNVVLPMPEGVDDYQDYLRTGRIVSRGGIQWGVYSIMSESFGEGSDRSDIPPSRRWLRRRPEFTEWLSGPETPKSGDLRVVHLNGEFDYVCGEVHRAYHFIRPSLSLRHVLLVKGDASGRGAYVVVCDEMESGVSPLAYAWQLHAGAPLTAQEDRVEIVGRSGKVGVRWLFPADGLLVRKQTPAPMASERTEFVQYQSTKAGSSSVFMTVMTPKLEGSKADEPAIRVIPAAGGWALEVLSPAGKDVVLFRSEQAESVIAAGVRTSGTAALFRQPMHGKPVVYTLGEPAPNQAR